MFTTFSFILSGINVLEMLNFTKKYLDTVTSEPHLFHIANLGLIVELLAILKLHEEGGRRGGVEPNKDVLHVTFVLNHFDIFLSNCCCLDEIKNSPSG